MLNITGKASDMLNDLSEQVALFLKEDVGDLSDLRQDSTSLDSSSCNHNSLPIGGLES